MNRCVRIMCVNGGYYRSEEVYAWSGGDIVRSSRDRADNSRDGVGNWWVWSGIGGYAPRPSSSDAGLSIKGSDGRSPLIPNSISHAEEGSTTVPLLKW